jgi:copper(I)-binding protein
MRWVNGWVASGLILAGLAVPSAGLANQQAAAGPAQSGPNGTELPAGPTHPYQPAGPAGPVELSQPWATPAPLGGDSNVMFTLRNYGDVRDDLLHAACATAGSTELVAPAPQGGAPARVDDLALAPGQKISLSADGTHIVLHHLDAPARLGQTLHCTATFAKSGERLFEADVRAAAPPPAPPI